MKVFLSWSGERSREAAKLLRDYLPFFSPAIEPFVSTHDIDSGARWYNEITVALEGSHFGVLCLTPDNLDSAWLLFEAGAITKHIDGKACGLLLEGLQPQDVSAPLSHFQHRTFDEKQLKALFWDIYKASDVNADVKRFDTLFEKFWPDIKVGYENAVKALASPATRHRRSSDEVLAEILDHVRSTSSGFSPITWAPAVVAEIKLAAEQAARVELQKSSGGLSRHWEAMVQFIRPLTEESRNALMVGRRLYDLPSVGAVVCAFTNHRDQSFPMGFEESIHYDIFMRPDSLEADARAVITSILNRVEFETVEGWPKVQVRSTPFD